MKDKRKDGLKKRKDTEETWQNDPYQASGTSQALTHMI